MTPPPVLIGLSNAVTCKLGKKEHESILQISYLTQIQFLCEASQFSRIVFKMLVIVSLQLPQI